MTLASVIKGRNALETKVDGAAHATGDSDDGLHAVFTLVPGHKIDYFTDAIRAQKARHQNIGVGQVHLLEATLHRRPDAKETAFFVVQNFGENAGRVEARQTAQSIEPSLLTSAAERQSPIIP